MLRLKCAAQTYAWGRPAAESEVIERRKKKRTIRSSSNAFFLLLRPKDEGRHGMRPGRIGPLFRRALRLPFSREQRESSFEGFCFLRIGAKRARGRLPAASLNNVEQQEIRDSACRQDSTSFSFQTKKKLFFKVASLAAAGGTAIDPSAPYAELWMGTHPSGPSEIIDESSSSGAEGAGEGSSSSCSKLLQSFLDDHAPAAVGAASAARFGAATLPFLFKVLSVRTALSIQSHPDKKLAERLHAEKPEVSW